MDSGIDSTDSSNGSVEDNAAGGEASVRLRVEGNGAGGGGVRLRIMERDIDEEPPFESPNIPNDNIQSSMVVAHPSVVPFPPPSPSPLRTLAAATAALAKKEALENKKNNNMESVEEGRAGAATSKSVEESAHDFLSTVKKPTAANFPAGSLLELHFPNDNKALRDVFSGRTCDLEPLPGLKFTNVSPCTFISTAESSSQGYSVLPYENSDLQKKLRTIRSRVRQHHYQVVLPRIKERRLRIAASLNNIEMVERLLKEGVNPRVADDKDRSPLHIAASKGYTEIARLLLQYGADPNQRDGVGNTALHLAACTSHIPTVTLLLRSGTNVRQADNQGYSPLHLARSKLKLLQRDKNSSSQDIMKQVYQVIEMMQTYLQCSGSTEEAELLTSLTSQLTLSDTREKVENDLQALLNSLHDLSLVKSKVA